MPDGDNSTCTDCAGVVNGDSELDYCGECDGGNVANDCCSVFDCVGTCADG